MTSSMPDIRASTINSELPTKSPCEILARIAPEVAPVLLELGQQAWSPKSQRQSTVAQSGRLEPVHGSTPGPFKVLMRRYDLSTLRTDWRLEAAGPMQLLEWDESGRVNGPYAFRYQVYTIRPVFDDDGFHCGYGVNCRFLRQDQSVYEPVDARMDCAVFVRSTDLIDLLAGLRSVDGSPRTEEGRPGLAPTDAYFELMQHINRTNYFLTWGFNEYVAPGWSADTLVEVFRNPEIRAVWLGL